MSKSKKTPGKVAHAVHDIWLQSADRRALEAERDEARAVATKAVRAAEQARAERDAMKAQLMQDQAALGQTLGEVKRLRDELRAARVVPPPAPGAPASSDPASKNNTKEATQ